MKKNNFKKIFVIFSLCVFLLSMFSISSFALNISDAHTGYLYEFKSCKYESSLNPTQTGSLTVTGYLVDKSSGAMTSFNALYYTEFSTSDNSYFYCLGTGSSEPNNVNIVDARTDFYGKIFIDFSNNSMSKSDFESALNEHWVYSVTALDSVKSMFDKANIALVGGTNGEGVAYDGLLGMVSKFGKFLVSSPLLLVLCIALPLVSFSVGLIIRIKNRA